jgi:hypothetical protein
MATTIVTKNGSGAPAAGDLVQGELAVDLTNQTLYSKDSSGNVFKVGDTGGGSPGTFTDLVATDSFTSPGIDDNATSTQITVTDTDVDFSGNIDVTGTATLPDADVTTLDVTGTTTLADVDVVDLDVTGSFTSPGIDDNATSTAITIDASENVGIGTNAPVSALHVDGDYVSVTNGTEFGYLQNVAGAFQVGTAGSSTAADLSFATQGTQRMRITSTGNVGIGTSSPSMDLEVYNLSGYTAARATSGTREIDLFSYTDVDGSGLLTNSGTPIVFYSGNNGENMRIDTTGNVGIGETNPSTALDVSTNAGNGNAGQIVKITNTNTSSGTAKTLTIGTDNYFASNPGMTIVAESGLSFGVGDGSDLAAQRDLVITSSGDFLVGSGSRTYTVGSGAYELDIAGGLNLSSGRDNGADMTFEVSNSERMRIDAAGNVGIGVSGSSLNESLVVQGNIKLRGASSVWFTNTSGLTGLEATSSVNLVLKNNATNGELGFDTNGSERMRISAEGNVGIGTDNPINSANYSTIDLRDTNGGQIVLGRTGTLDGYMYSQAGLVTLAAAAGNSMAFLVNSPGGGQGEAMRIDTSGNLLVGTTNTDPITNKAPGVLIQSNGAINSYSGSATSVNLGRANNGVMMQFWINGANTSGGISTTQGGTPVFFASSDERLKDNIVDHESELANVMSLRPTRWDWKKEEQGSGEGFIAQELEQTAWSDLVSEGEDGFKTVAGLGAVETRLIKAMQEQQAMIETLKAEVAALKGA